MYADALTFSGFHALEASSGLEALQLAIDCLPDLILMDLSLPWMDGWEVTSRLKKDSRTKHIPIIALTAHALTEERERAEQAGGQRAPLPLSLASPTSCLPRSSGCWPPSNPRPDAPPFVDRLPSRSIQPPQIMALVTLYTHARAVPFGCRVFQDTPSRPMANEMNLGARATGLVEVLDRILDKGFFVGGDIKISLAEVELLTIRIRLIVCSLDKAKEIGLDWWMYDRHLSPGRAGAADRDVLEQRIAALERQLGAAPVTSRRRREPPRAANERRSARGELRDDRRTPTWE